MLCRASPSSAASDDHLLPSSPAEKVMKNDELLTLILIRLPPKSIFKFKSVSKRWFAIIISPSFVPKRHSKAISGVFLGLFKPSHFLELSPLYGFINLMAKTPNSSGAPPFMTLDFAVDMKIIQSYNGFFLCSNKNVKADKTSFYVYNPTTNRSTALPELWLKPSLIAGASLAFDQSKSSHYKVICLIHTAIPGNSPEYYFVLEIYSSETQAWKLYRDGDPFPGTDVDFTNGVFWNGTVHWLSRYCKPSLRFDVEQEQLRDLLMLPLITPEPEPNLDEEEDEDADNDHGVRLQFMTVRYRLRFFGESRNHLNFVEIHQSKPLQFEVYEVEPDYSGWFVRCKVDLSPVVEVFPERVLSKYIRRALNNVLTILSVVREEDDDESYLVLLFPNCHMVVQYKLNDGSFSKICELDPDDCRVMHDDHFAARLITQSVYPFIQTLAPVWLLQPLDFESIVSVHWEINQFT